MPLIPRKFAAVFQDNRVLRNIGVLAGGMALARGFAFAAMPLLTRVYTPGEFAVLAAYMSLLNMVLLVANLRLEMAIPLCSDDDAANVLVLALLSTFVTVAVLSLALALLTVEPAAESSFPIPTTLIWLLPVATLGGGIYQALRFWALRKDRYRLISQTQFTRTASGTGTQLALGYAGTGPLGLLLGHAVFSSFGSFAFLRSMWRQDRRVLSAVNLPAMRRNLWNYRHFPYFSVPEALFNSGGVNVPVLLIATYAAGPEAGFLALSMQVMSIPMILIGGSVAQVFRVEAPSKYRDGTLRAFTLSTSKTLFKLAVGPLMAIGITAPFVFPWLFGEGWARSGQIVAWMTPWYLLQFTASPVSVVLHITGQLRIAMLLQVFGFVVRLGVVAFALTIGTGFVTESFAVGSAVFYAVYVWVIFRILAKV